MIQVDNSIIQDIIDRAFEEDIGSGDVTTNAIVNEHSRARAIWISKGNGIAAGLKVAQEVFRRLDPNIAWITNIEDGTEIKKGATIVEIEGACRSILTAERIALNIAQRMSGIATKTRQLVEAINDYPAVILDTRKTVPGLRYLDKMAVKLGSGTNHRMGLYDLAMIKDNHIVAAGNISRAVEMVRRQNQDITIEVETINMMQVEEALSVGVDIIMLDNMTPTQMEKAVDLVAGRAKTEASGNITLNNVAEVAATGVDYISSGALTHSVNAFDISQQVQKIFN